jgi:hypothetical protein
MKKYEDASKKIRKGQHIEMFPSWKKKKLKTIHLDDQQQRQSIFKKKVKQKKRGEKRRKRIFGT